MDAMRDTLIATGVDPTNIHSETFGTMPAVNPGMTPSAIRPHMPSAAPSTGPRVTFSRVGLTVRWSPRYQTLLELAEACDVPTRYSCRSGVCHLCTTGLVAGSVAYPRQPLEEPNAGSTLICCAAPLTDIVLDL
jgi:ferredoxin